MLPYDEAGAGPAVVLLHAGIADRGMWAEHLERLAGAGFRAIAPDLPGFGDALAVPGGPAPWTAVTQTLDALGVERAVIVGNSLGGAVALRVAVIAPTRVAGLVLVSAPPIVLDPSPRLAAAWEAEESALEAGDVEAAVDAVVDAWTLPGAPPSVRDQVAAMQRRAFTLQASLPEDDEPEPPDPVETDPAVVDRIQAPALVAVGEHDMPDFHDGAQDLAQRLPRAAAPVVIANAGHLAPLETPEAFVALLLDFLEREIRR
jgi:pimeloyl-ACP methyl ester carboxylesterase